MAVQLPPIPNNPVTDVFVWRDWFFKVSQLLVQQASIAWTSIDFTGSNLQDIQTRQHNALQSIQGGVGGQYYHLTQSEYSTLQALTPLKYGAFHDNTTQTAAVINTAYAVTFDSTDLSSGIALGTPTSRVVITKTGIYNFQFSAQLHKTNASVGYVYIWARVNGTDIAESASKISINGSQAETIAAWNFVLSMAANDYFQLMWSTDDTHCQLLHNTTVSPVPGIPSVILTATQVA